jgi:hypothetical protein
MSLQVKRLHLATMLDEWPVHGFLVTYLGGAVLADTGVGGPQQVLADHRVVNRSVSHPDASSTLSVVVPGSGADTSDNDPAEHG